jgi:hypothetical protein
MSYILESLKKSDKERQVSENAVAIALSNDSYFMEANDAPTSGFIYLLIAIVVVSLLLVFFWWKASSVNTDMANFHEETPMQLTQKLVAKPAVSLQQKDAILPDVIKVNEPVVSLREVVLVDNASEAAQSLYEKNIQLVADKDVATLYREGAKPVERIVDNKQASIGLDDKVTPVELVLLERKSVSSIPSIYDLDRSTQKKIPAITYGAHIYASDNKSGFVILNGAKRKAGEKMRSGIYIEKVAESELVLSYQGLVFSLPAMKNWTP